MGVQNPQNIQITGFLKNPNTGRWDGGYVPAGAGVPRWSEDFEGASDGDALTTLGFIRTNATVSTVRAYSGTKSAMHTQVQGSDMSQQYGAARALPENLAQGDEFWIRTYFFFPTGWDFGNAGDAGLGGNAPRSKFFRLHTQDGVGGNKGYNDLYLYNQDANTQRWNWIKEQNDYWAFDGLDGYAPGRPQAPNANITRNQWVPVEYYIKLHSDPAQARVRVWVGNVLQVNITDLATLSAATDVADEWQFCTYYNGGAPANQSMWTDKWEVYTSKTTGAPNNTDASGNVFIGGSVAAPAFLAEFLFRAGDTMAMNKSGLTWQSGGTETIDAASGETETGVNIVFNGTPDPSSDVTFERRFDFSQMGEVYIHHRFHVPSNYYHRAVLNLSISGDISTWQIGDVIVAGDSTSTGTVYWINGANVALLNAQNNLYGSGVWTANITNTTRSEVRSSTRLGNEPNNNKLFAIWCDAYSSAGAGASVVWEMYSDEAGGSSVFYHFGADNQVTGSLPNSTSESIPFISSADVGKWFDVVYYVKAATTEFAADGIIRMWVKREGEGTYTQIFDQTNALIGPRAAAGNAQWQHGYIHGWQNSGYAETTILRVSEFAISDTAFAGV